VTRAVSPGLVPEPPRSGGAWAYWRPDAQGVVEMGAVAGHDVALPPHFHDEHQLTFVRRGRRRFVVGDRAVVVSAGAAAWLPARVPHRSLAEPDGVECVNVYVRAGEYDQAAIVRSVELHWAARGRLDAHDVAAAVQRHRLAGGSEPPPGPGGVLPRHARVAEAAAHGGMSREGYSRAFAARYGMPPAAYRRAARLNDARRLLRDGEELAAAAAQSGFADQSHLGRWFRRAFGVTPGRYRHGSRASQAF
jgi:AraC-like DNA-binding protein/quercetin dioxygenase-like cupin family protein